MMRYRTIYAPVLGVLVILGLFSVIRRGESGVEVAPAGSADVLVTIDTPGRSPLSAADSLRKAFRFDEARELYRAVAEDENAHSHLRAEARYYDGLCSIWKGEWDDAERLYRDMLTGYADDGEAVANAQYCLAWLEVQKGEYNSAIARLSAMLNEKTCGDEELYARAQFKIGHIYLGFLNDRVHASEAFNAVKSDYPDSWEAGHPYVTGKIDNTN